MDTVFMDAGQSLRLDGKTALVIGGSSGIGNGIAQCFRQQGATVHVSGTRVDASAYDDDEGSVLTGLHYSQLDARGGPQPGPGGPAGSPGGRLAAQQAQQQQVGKEAAVQQNPIEHNSGRFYQGSSVAKQESEQIKTDLPPSRR